MAVSAVLACLLAGCGAGPVDVGGEQTVSGEGAAAAVAGADQQGPAELHDAAIRAMTVDGQRGLVVTADHPVAGARQVALVLHGAGSDRRAIIEKKAETFTQSLIDAGWVVAASDAHGDAWGAAGSQRDHLELLTRLRSEFPVGGVVLVSLSMGGIAGLHLAASGSIPDLAGWVGITPVTNLPAIARDRRFSASIRTALTGDQIASLDPASIPPDRFRGVPLIVTESPGRDPWTPPQQQVAPFVAHVGSIDPVRVIDCSGGHVGADCYPTAVVVALGAGRRSASAG
jgi:hypothetical protein